MKVLHLTTHLDFGGITRYLQILGPAMARRGHEVLVVSSGGRGEGELEKAGIRCMDLPLRTKSIVHPKLLAALPSVIRMVRKEKVDLMHAHSRVTQFIAFWASYFTGIPFMSTAHGFYKAHWGRKLLPCWGERVVAVSPLVAEELQKAHGVDPKNIRIVQNALDIEALEKCLALSDPKAVKAFYGIPKKALVVGSISRLVRDKGHEYLVEAVRRLVSDLPDIFLLIIGDGREKAFLGSLVEKSGLTERTRMVPGTEDTAGALSAMDIFVHPATFREGFGLSIAEAMIAKRPVVATDIPAIHTIFKNGSNAVLVPPKDAAALAAAIRGLLQDKTRARAVADAGYALAGSLCRSERQAGEMEAVYIEVLETWKKKKN